MPGSLTGNQNKLVACRWVACILEAFHRPMFPGGVMLCYAMLCYAMLCHAMLCYAMLCFAMLCYAMPCHALPMTHRLAHRLAHCSGNSTGNGIAALQQESPCQVAWQGCTSQPAELSSGHEVVFNLMSAQQHHGKRPDPTCAKLTHDAPHNQRRPAGCSLLRHQTRIYYQGTTRAIAKVQQSLMVWPSCLHAAQ